MITSSSLYTIKDALEKFISTHLIAQLVCCNLVHLIKNMMGGTSHNECQALFLVKYPCIILEETYTCIYACIHI